MARLNAMMRHRRVVGGHNLKNARGGMEEEEEEEKEEMIGGGEKVPGEVPVCPGVRSRVR